MKAELNIYSLDGEWPRCFYDSKLRCGESATGALVGYTQTSEEGAETVRRSWHVADMCNCPSCPLRVAISTAVRQL